MEIFYDDPEVLFVSIHQDPRFFYPGTGFTAQSGKGRGEGYTVNIPMKPGAGDDDYIFLFEEFIAPLVERFEPQFICVSCGLDAHKDDPISQIELTEYGFRSLSNLLCQSARKLCNGRLFLCLEGGYNLEGLKRSVGGIIESLLDEKQEDTHYNQNKVKSSTMSLLETLQGLNFL
jgi:acetoin utilization deacetylase AcuC-like enzyme